MGMEPNSNQTKWPRINMLKNT